MFWKQADLNFFLRNQSVVQSRKHLVQNLTLVSCRGLASGKLKQQSDPYQGEQIRGIFLISTDMCTREGNTDCPKRIFRDFVDGLIGRAGVFICKKSMSIS